MSSKIDGGQFEQIGVFEAGEIGLIVENRPGLIDQPIGRVPIVVVPLRDQFAARFTAR